MRQLLRRARRSDESGLSATPTAARRRPAAVVAGVLFLVLGLSLVGWVSWELFANPLMDPAASSQKVESLKSVWETSPTPAVSTSPTSPTAARKVPGDALALLRIPDFGSDYEVPVVYGTDDDSLSKGVGWFEDTADPGAIGNFAVAGHRGSRGPFHSLPSLKAGARIEIETRDAIYVYVLDNNPADLTVQNKDLWVLDPVPGQPDRQPTQALITLVTCAELFRAPDRTIAFGHLVQTMSK